MRHFALPLSLAAATTLACEGAGTEVTTDNDSALGLSTFNLEMENGGFDEESPETAAALDDLVDLSVGSEPEEEAPALDETPEPAGDLDRYVIRLVWGHPGRPDLELGKPPAGAYDRDWDGSVTTTEGMLRAGRPIRFEPAEDKLLPRSAPETVAFESTTHGHVDGLRLRLAVPAGSEGELVVQLAGLPEMRIPHAKLRHHVSGRRVDELGNGVSIVAFADGACRKATADGHWMRTGKRGGVFRGAVEDAAGAKIGVLKGIWGVRKDGERRFYGLYLADGEPAARVRGTWTGLDNADGGFFRGHTVTKVGHRGVLMGHFRTEVLVPQEVEGAAPPAGKRGGVFHAVYISKCSDEAPTTDVPADTAAPELCADELCVAEPQFACDADAMCEDVTDAL